MKIRYTDKNINTNIREINIWRLKLPDCTGQENKCDRTPVLSEILMPPVSGAVQDLRDSRQRSQGNQVID